MIDRDDVDRYIVSHPQFFHGQDVEFVDHHGNKRIGQIMRVSTWYDCQNCQRHSYAIRQNGHVRHTHHDEKEIVRVIP